MAQFSAAGGEEEDNPEMAGEGDEEREAMSAALFGPGLV
jgi:hypothetical protein